MEIFVVDDEEIILESCRFVLEAEGYNVSIFISADKLFEVFDSKVPDLMLIDMKMPNCDGICLMQEIRRKTDIPIILMSGYTTRETASEAMKKGAASFISKPFTPDELLNEIVQVIKKEPEK